jgi:hypothetical protein
MTSIGDQRQSAFAIVHTAHAHVNGEPVARPAMGRM